MERSAVVPPPSSEDTRDYIFDMIRELADLSARNGEPAVAILLEAIVYALSSETMPTA